MKWIKFLVVMVTVLGCHCGVWALDGSWRGDLVIGQRKMPIVFNFLQGDDGKMTATMDSPNQGVKGISADVLFCSDDSVSVRSESIGAVFNGKISRDAIDGVFSQRGYNFPLKLMPEVSLEERRPQTPKPPFRYDVIDTVFVAKDGAKLAGTLVFPYTHKSTKMPMVVMVTGSGPQNRDEEVFDHRPFAVLADRLAAKGIASFRYDDRGVGESEGNFAESDTYTFADDARSAVDFVKNLPQTGKVGVLGHSEGGTIAFMLGATDDVDFLISMAGVAIPAKEVLLAQNRHSLKLNGMSDEDIDSWMNILSPMFDEMHRLYDEGKTEKVDIERIIAENDLSVSPVMLSFLTSKLNSGASPQIYCLMSLVPEKWLKNIKQPLLAINGDKDTQVDAVANLSVIEHEVKNSKVKSYPGLNHMFQHCETGEVAEYGEIRETMSEEVIDDIIAFILSL